MLTSQHAADLHADLLRGAPADNLSLFLRARTCSDI